MATSAVARKGIFGQLGLAFRKWNYNHARYNQLGLLHDDLLDELWFPEVQEAIRRLPKDLYDERNFRIIRATQLSISKDILPKEEWPAFGDEKHHYLAPYVKEVKREMQEKAYWDGQ